METILEETCRDLPNGGNHSARKYVADKLVEAVNAGHVTLGELGIVARKALSDLADTTSSSSLPQDQ